MRQPNGRSICGYTAGASRLMSGRPSETLSLRRPAATSTAICVEDVVDDGIRPAFEAALQVVESLRHVPPDRARREHERNVHAEQAKNQKGGNEPRHHLVTCR